MGNRVRHKVTGQLGFFSSINLGFALPEVWVEFDILTESALPLSCNPLDLELITSTDNQHKEISEVSESQESEITQLATVELVEELTEQEQCDRHRLELRVERAFYEAGAALRELRDRRLYRSTHKTWEAYCQDRFGFGRDSADLKILASLVVEEIRDNLPTNRRQILPTTLEQVRPLIKLKDASKRIDAWVTAVDINNGKVPSGRIVKGIVERLKEKPLFLASNFCTVGDVFTLTRLEGGERKYNGCWAQASAVKDFTVEVEVHDGTLNMKPENLNRIDDPEVCRQLPQILKRIKRLRNLGFLDRGADNVLEDLGRHTYLTPVEEGLLSWLEKYYGVDDEQAQ